MRDLTDSESIAQVMSIHGTPWLSVEDHGDDCPIWVRIAGGILGDRADDMWSTLEAVVQEAVGRMVILDLVAVAGFDISAVEAVVSVARAVKRWHLDMCAVVQSHSAMDDYLRSYAVDRLISVYGSSHGASTTTDVPELLRADQQVG